MALRGRLSDEFTRRSNTMYRSLPNDFKDALLQDANKYLSLSNPKPSPANPFNGTSKVVAQ